MSYCAIVTLNDVFLKISTLTKLKEADSDPQFSSPDDSYNKLPTVLYIMGSKLGEKESELWVNKCDDLKGS